MKNTIFVFGSNEQGIHGKGAALFAKNFYSAKQGVGVGLSDMSYAIPTKKTPYQSLSIYEVKSYVDEFLEFAESHSELTFQVSRIGCGLAGFKDEEMFPLFQKRPNNVQLPYVWLKIENPNLHPKIIIAGGRDFNDFKMMKEKCDKILSHFSGELEIVSGGAKGADKLGQDYAKKVLGIEPTIFPANWQQHGKASGMVRNEVMAWYGSHLIAFWDGKSKGTKNMIDIAQREKMPTRIVNYTIEIQR